MKPSCRVAGVDPLAAAAASLEDIYFAARDGYIEKFKPRNQRRPRRGRRKQEELRAPTWKISCVKSSGRRPQGFSAPEKQPRHAVHGLFRLRAAERPGLFVEGRQDAHRRDHRRAARRWLRQHKTGGTGLANVPQDVDAALKSEAFYTSAAHDAAISKYVELPFASREREVRLRHAGRAQPGHRPRTPDELIVSMLRMAACSCDRGGQRQIDPMPACRAWRTPCATRQGARGLRGVRPEGQAAVRASTASKRKRCAFHRCFAQRAKAKPSSRR